MNWQQKLPDDELARGILMIVGDPYAKKTQQLTPNNLNEIANAIENGFIDRRGFLRQIVSLELIQVGCPKNAATFRAFLARLAAVPHFKSLDFSLKTISPDLTHPQLDALATVIRDAQYLETLKIRAIDNADSANLCATILRRNRYLTHFACNVTDDAFRYTVLKAALETDSPLRQLDLPRTIYASMLPYPLPIPQAQIRNSRLSILFEGEKRVNIASLLLRTSEPRTFRRPREEELTPENEPVTAARRLL